MKQIALSKGGKCLVSDIDYEIVSKANWYKNYWGYVARTDNKLGKTIYMHRVIFNRKKGLKDGLVIDHINGNSLDNRRSNLRQVTVQKNSFNQKSFSGVSYYKRDKVWQAHIRFNYKLIHLGYFKEKSQAIRARLEANKKYFGKYNLFVLGKDIRAGYEEH